MISAEDAYNCYWENSKDAIQQQLELIDRKIKEACINSKTYITLGGNLFQEVMDELKKMDYYTDTTFRGEIMISWSGKAKES
jgi:hypothetical protein